jgi:hypothetical protein
VNWSIFRYVTAVMSWTGLAVLMVMANGEFGIILSMIPLAIFSLMWTLPPYDLSFEEWTARDRYVNDEIDIEEFERLVGIEVENER